MVGGGHLTHLQSTQLCISYLLEIVCTYWAHTHVYKIRNSAFSVTQQRHDEWNRGDVRAIMHKTVLRNFKGSVKQCYVPSRMPNSGEDRSKDEVGLGMDLGSSPCIRASAGSAVLSSSKRSPAAPSTGPRWYPASQLLSLLPPLV